MAQHGRGTARAEDAQGTTTQSHISTSILQYMKMQTQIVILWIRVNSNDEDGDFGAVRCSVSAYSQYSSVTQSTVCARERERERACVIRKKVRHAPLEPPTKTPGCEPPVFQALTPSHSLCLCPETVLIASQLLSLQDLI